MKRLQSIKYGDNDAPRINELSPDEVAQIRQRLLSVEENTRAEVFLQLCTEEFSDRTFCSQTDYDSHFGNISWQRAYLFYSDAESVIRKNEEDLNKSGTPVYLRDDSYISIYELGELANDLEKSSSAVDDLIRKVMAYKPPGA